MSDARPHDHAITLAACRHCGQDVGVRSDGFCCLGCETVYALLHSSGLEKFYALRPQRIVPQLNYFQRQHTFEWLDTHPGVASGAVVLAIEGIQCAACVWAIQELARRHGIARVDIDVTHGVLTLRYDPQTAQLREYVQTLQRIGYRTQPQRQGERARGDHGLLLRLGACLAIAMNTMFLAISLYAGLDASDSQVFRVFTELNFYLSFLSVAIGGSYFFGRAWQALRHRVLHFDLPVALGIAGAFGSSLWNHLRHDYNATYFDTINVFIALMLVGRYLQERLIARNRNQLLDDAPLQHMRVQRIVGEGDAAQLEDIPCAAVAAGDQLQLQPGSIVPVACTLAHAFVECSLAWINGESQPVAYVRGALLPAGAVIVSNSAVLARATQAFADSALSTLAPHVREQQRLPVVWEWVVKRYVIIVLTAATTAFALWSWIDPSRALEICAAILIVTCPCSLGISIPLVRSRANRALLRRGIVARDAGLLDKLGAIRHVFLDKTGTLTLATLELLNPSVLRALPVEHLTILYNMTARSRHPASVAVYQWLAARQLPWLPLAVEEIAGKGLRCQCNGHLYTVGRFADALASSSAYTVVFSHNDSVLAELALREETLDAVRPALDALTDAGITTYLLSGDVSPRVVAMARESGIAVSRTFAGCTPASKAALIEQYGQGAAMMIGDGINDTLAFNAATVCGGPVWERSALAHHADFFYIAGTLAWLPELFRVAAMQRRVIQMNLWFALLYNVSTIVLAMMGIMSPLLCAVLMPAGSLTVIGVSLWQMKRVV